MTWLLEHVRSRYASGHVVVVPADHRGYEHSVDVPLTIRMAARVFVVDSEPLCVTLRGASPPRICDCGMYALEWMRSGPRDEAARTNDNGEETA
jgi:hypothetical protein